VRLIRRFVALVIFVIVIGAVWAGGALDGPLHLYSLGLNARDCFRDYKGTVSCGTTNARARCRDRAGHGLEIGETSCYPGRAP
jgi:hypothetical protein